VSYIFKPQNVTATRNGPHHFNVWTVNTQRILAVLMNSYHQFADPEMKYQQCSEAET
jgi:hypothetical protein